ncbi:hypothetical protein [Nocardia alni]|uniref:hypothetical protein n=1 Tax=Nocardia alni TaxID=2815723 RepID=UPI001C2284C5|nr:hypothetical protein [Nocardia alni]
MAAWASAARSRGTAARSPDAIQQNVPIGDDQDGRNLHQRLLATAIDGLYATDAAPLPGYPPTWEHYEQRWRTDPTQHE